MLNYQPGVLTVLRDQGIHVFVQLISVMRGLDTHVRY